MRKPKGTKLRASHKWPRDPDDWYVENEWCSAALFREFELTAPPIKIDLGAGAVNAGGRFATVVLDPACGSGRIVRAARSAGYDACGSDIKARWLKFETRRPERGTYAVRNFLTRPKGQMIRPHWIVSNPPFKHCWTREEAEAPPFIAKALALATEGAALLLPHDWMAGDRRERWLSTAGLLHTFVCVPRPSMPPGNLILAGETPGNGEHNFAWYIFRKGHKGAVTTSWLRRDA